MPEAPSSSSLFAEANYAGGKLIIKLLGPSIGQREVPILTDIIAEAIEQKANAMRMLVLDLSQITFMNSMALGMCLHFRKTAAQLPGNPTTAIVGMNEELTKLFKMVKFDKLFTLQRSIDDLK
jgi:anti-anti-sigma factor